MYKFESRPIQITGNDLGFNVLCEDGSIWKMNMHGEPSQIASYEKPVKTKAKAEPKEALDKDGYTESFKYMWDLWASNIKNTSNKKKSFVKWEALSKEDRTALCYSIAPFAKTESVDRHKFLMRCETFIHNSGWQGVEVFEEIGSSSIPHMNDPIWDTEIKNNNTGITEKAYAQINSFGMSREKAWELINEKGEE